MNKPILVALLAIVLPLSALAQEESEKKIKKGWTLSLLPCATYSTDLGFQYGAFGDVYYFGDGNTYPDPLHKFSWEVSHFTKGRTRFYLAYDSKYLIPKMRVTASAFYMDDPFYSFYGFNGLATDYDPALMSNKETKTAWYSMKRNILKLVAGLQGQIVPGLKWAGGLSFWTYDEGTFGDRYGYDPENTLYNHYRSNGVIKADEAAGGKRLEVKAGLVYDTRDIEAAPNKGFWSEIYLNGSPDVFKNGYQYLKLCAHWRHYIRIPVGFIKAGDPVFAYHLAYQGTIAGEAPFFVQQSITALDIKDMLPEGLGSGNTIRGTYNNRIVADGYLWSNFELRVKLFHFKLLRQFFYVATNPFFDCGFVTKTYREAEMSKLAEMAGVDIKAKASTLVKTAGIGLKLAWNENFIISTEFAHNFNKGLGDPLWISIGASYAF